jgi:uncharacterized OB-fold protein
VYTVTNEDSHLQRRALGQVPIVDYLVLGDHPHLRVHECTACGARFFARRNACAACFATEFHYAQVATTGVLRTFTIVAQAALGVQVPFISGIVDCDGTSLRTNIINVEPDAQHVHTGMEVTLRTYSLGPHGHASEVIGFGYEPNG